MVTKRQSQQAATRRSGRNTTSQRAGVHVWRKTFLKVLALNGNVTAACNSAGVERSTVYDLRKSDQAFAAQWSDALEQAADTLEAAAFKRAVKGVRRVMHSAGKVVGVEYDYSDSLLQTLLKAKRPNEYRERIQIEHVGIKAALPILQEIYNFLEADNLDFTEAQRQFLEMLKAAKARADAKKIESQTK